jgi:penicillin-binding protein 1A
LDDGIIEQSVYDDAVANPPALSARLPDPNIENALHFTEEVRRYLFERLGGDMVLGGGLVIETTLDADLQAAAVKAVRAGLHAHDHRRGYRGPVRQVPQPEVGAEIARLAEENELLPDEEGVVPGLSLDEPKLGVVTRVDLDSDFALIAFADGVRGQAALQDVSWAREADIERRPRSVKQIEKVFAVGDVARFIRLEGDPLVPVDESETVEPEPDAEAGPDAVAPPAPLPLARVDIYQDPEVEGALLSMEIETGDVRALVGGYDYNRSQFNRATQALRQPGSAFKPFIYGAALSRDYTPVSTLWDRPAVYEDPISGFVWRPQNYGRHFYGPLPLRQALVRSINNATVHLFRDVGVDYVIDYARRVGIQSPLSRDLSLALGSSSLGLVELTTAYAVFPNQGRRVIPRFITQVTDREGQVLLGDISLGTPPPPVVKPLAMEGELGIDGAEEVPTYPDAEILPTDQVISEAAAYLMCDLLQGVVFDPRGTGHRLRKLGRPLAGKTGTTNDQKDAWFMGFSPGIVTGVWVGRDDSKVLGWGETGSRAAAPIWVEYMDAALASRPILDFEEPEHIVKVRVDRKSGLLADADSEDAYFQPFLEGSEPEESTTGQKTAGDVRRALREDFF